MSGLFIVKRATPLAVYLSGCKLCAGIAISSGVVLYDPVSFHVAFFT